MNAPSTLYRFKIDLSDIDRGVYESLDFRIAMHPSETLLFLMTRVFAYVLNFQEGLKFSAGGISDTEEPAISHAKDYGGYKIWIEIGNPSVKKLHKGSKQSDRVKIYTHRDIGAFLREIAGANIHRAEEIELYSIAPEFLTRVANLLERDNRWNIVYQDGQLNVGSGERMESGEIKRFDLIGSGKPS